MHTAVQREPSCRLSRLLPRPLTILEGSYSLHPALQTDFAVRVFVTCPPDVQAARLRRERVYVTQILCSGGSRWRKGILLPMIQPHAAILYWTRRRFLCNIVSGPMA